MQCKRRRQGDHIEPLKSTIKIFNLSKYELSRDERSVLEKGLSFAPQSKPDDFQLFIDLNKFIRKLTLQRHFSLCESGKVKEVAKESSDENLIVQEYVERGVTDKDTSPHWPS